METWGSKATISGSPKTTGTQISPYILNAGCIFVPICSIETQAASHRWTALGQSGAPHGPWGSESIRYGETCFSRPCFMTGVVQMASDTSAQFNPKQNQILWSRVFFFFPNAHCW